MKRNAFATLIKDVLLAVIAWGLGLALLHSGFDLEGAALQGAAFYVACIPFGWRWASNIITAVSLRGIGLKLLISLFLGMFAIFVVLGGDVLRCLGRLASCRKRSHRAGAVE